MSLKEDVKQYAYDLGADLVGFGNIERCANAPIMMSPQGLMPKAKTVIVMALHHPDAAVELGGEEHPQKIGPYCVQYLMNSRLDEMSYRMGTFIEDKGFDVIPICSSNIWRYNKYKELNAVFAPDVSNIYMPVVAGLADMGYSGLALTPEFGARNRFVTVITDADIEPDPLIKPGTNCDGCMLCRKHCPSQALSKEINGESVLKIEGYEYRFANKNLWRCAWGEHFDLDLDLELPEKVTEQVIVEKVKKHGIRGGEMGQCLKFCVPKSRRYFDKEYSKSPLRKGFMTVYEEMESRAFNDKLLTECSAKGAEFVLVRTKDELAAQGIDIGAHLPSAETAITLVITNNAVTGNKRPEMSDKIFRFGAGYQVDSICYDLTRKLEENGFKSVTPQKGVDPVSVDIITAEGLFKECGYEANTVVTTKKIKSVKHGFGKETARVPVNRRSSLTTMMKKVSLDLGADLVGVSSAGRLNGIASHVRETFEGEEIIVAKDNSHRFKKWEPEIDVETRKIFTPEDYVPGAKSVIVIGMRFHEEVLRRATKPPAEAVGPYSFQTYVTEWLCSVASAGIAKKLQQLGYRAAATGDLMNTGSLIATPRGMLEDTFSNRFAAFGAGLGWLTTNGRVATPEFGLRQRFFAVVTDAELDEDVLCAPAKEDDLCRECGKMCMTACPTKAISSEMIEFPLEDTVARFAKIDNKLCDWSKRYALIGESGFKYLGSQTDEDPHGNVTPAKLAEALKKHDPIKKYRPVVVEPCMLKCPYFDRS